MNDTIWLVFSIVGAVLLIVLSVLGIGTAVAELILRDRPVIGVLVGIFGCSALVFVLVVLAGAVSL